MEAKIRWNRGPAMPKYGVKIFDWAFFMEDGEMGAQICKGVNCHFWFGRSGETGEITRLLLEWFDMDSHQDEVHISWLLSLTFWFSMKIDFWKVVWTFLEKLTYESETQIRLTFWLNDESVPEEKKLYRIRNNVKIFTVGLCSKISRTACQFDKKKSLGIGEVPPSQWSVQRKDRNAQEFLWNCRLVTD